MYHSKLNTHLFPHLLQLMVYSQHYNVFVEYNISDLVNCGLLYDQTLAQLRQDFIYHLKYINVFNHSIMSGPLLN